MWLRLSSSSKEVILVVAKQNSSFALCVYIVFSYSPNKVSGNKRNIRKFVPKEMGKYFVIYLDPVKRKTKKGL